MALHLRNLPTMKLLRNIKHSCSCYHGNCPWNLFDNQAKQSVKSSVLPGYAINRKTMHTASFTYTRLNFRLQNLEKLTLTSCSDRFDQFSSARFKSTEARSSKSHAEDRESMMLEDAELDWDYLTNPLNRESIQNCIVNRKGVGNVDRVVELWKRLHDESVEIEDFCECQEDVEAVIRKELLREASLIPNKTHPDVAVGDESNAVVIDMIGEKKEFSFKPKSVIKIGEDLDTLRVENVGLTTGPRTYYLKHEFALLEQALIRYTLQKLISKGFTLLSVPDLIHPAVIEGCGFPTHGERSQVYRLDPDNHENACLAGTAEMSLAGYFMNRNLVLSQLPQRVVAVSRCFRAETSAIAEEKGIYRVHQFTKVEMFCVTADEDGGESEQLMQEVMNLQRQMFSELGLHCRILDMPTHELGAPAYRKYDIEAWMPEKEMFGEISSTSNCTDYQSRRLHIKYRDNENNAQFAHTVNGTACAIPRMIMAIVENNQNQDGSVDIPSVLQPYMKGMTVITKPTSPPQMKFMKITRAQKRNT